MLTLLFAGFGKRSDLNKRSRARQTKLASIRTSFEPQATRTAPSVVHSLRQDSWLAHRTDTCNFLNISHAGFRRRAGSSPLIRARASSSRQ